mgnify:CR=1 FL=1
MKKSTIVLLVIGVIILGIIIFAISGYNSLVKMEELFQILIQIYKGEQI